VELRARLDTGDSDCIFDESYLEILGITTPGLQRDYRTVTGLFRASGHEITIETLDGSIISGWGCCTMSGG
jgi:hypothetical protein